MALRHTDEGWVCSSCGAVHTGLLTVFGQDEPDAWRTAPWHARFRGWREKSFCRVPVGGERRFFVRGHLSIPLTGHHEKYFVWSVWVRVSEADYRMSRRTMDDPRRVDQTPVSGRLEAWLPYAFPTSGLPVEVRQCPPGEVPQVVVVGAPAHPLQRQQKDGMDVHELAELNRELLP